MRLETLRCFEVYDPCIANAFPPPIYKPLRTVQYLGIFRTQYSITGTAQLCSPRHAKMHAKKDAYQRHMMEIERCLMQGKGGEHIHIEEHYDADRDIWHKFETPFRHPYSYQEFLDAGLPLNAKMCLLGLKGRTMEHIRRWVPDLTVDRHDFEWVSEVALGVQVYHERGTEIDNPFRMGWREL